MMQWMEEQAGLLAIGAKVVWYIDVGSCDTLQLCPGRTDTLCQRLCKL